MGSLAEPPWSEVQDEWEALITPPADPWESTIGDAQYQWLKRTLEESEAKYKFVFAHHVFGTGRGAVEMARSHTLTSFGSLRAVAGVLLAKFAASLY